MMTVISLGAGVQSTTMALMAARGEIGPMPDCAIFADTQSEPAGVYRHLDWLERQLPFPTYRVTAGSLRSQIIMAMDGRARMDARPPFFTKSGGMLRRQCTHDFKIVPIERKIRELLGLRKGQRGPKDPMVEQWIGISIDEATRMKPSRRPYIRHRWPLIEMSKSRHSCIGWCAVNGYPRPPKSACTFCPYRDDVAWRHMRDEDPASFVDACHVDKVIRPGMAGPGRPSGEGWFIHRSRVPLEAADLSTPLDWGQPDLFMNECEGMCGV